MAKQKIFKDDYIAALLKDLDAGNIEKYFAETFDVQDKFDNGESTTIETRLDHPDDLYEKMSNSSNKCEAAIILFEAFKDLTPLEASRKYLWVYLELTDLFPYVKSITNTARTKSAIKDNWFGSSIRGALSSMWWMVYLTADHVETDPEKKYKYTRYFMSDGHSQLRQELSQSTLFRCRDFVKEILDFFISNDFHNETEVATKVMKYFNRKGGLTQIAALSKQDIKQELNNIEWKTYTV